MQPEGAFRCPYCHTPDLAQVTTCPRCQNSLVVGQLVSLGAGVVPAGQVWDLLPKKNRLGRDRTSNDIIIDSNLVGKRQASLIFKSIGFLVINANRDQQCIVNGKTISKAGSPLATGDHLKFGVEEFEYQFKFDATKAMPRPAEFVPQRASIESVDDSPSEEDDSNWSIIERVEEIEAREEASTVARELRHHEEKVDTLLASISELLNQANSATNPSTVMAHALDTVLFITRLSRGIAYLIVQDEEGEVGIQEMAARVQGRKGISHDDEAYQYPVNQEMLELAYGEMYPILVDNPFSEDLIDTQRIGYQGVLALPISSYNAHTGQREIRALIYADTLQIRGPMERDVDGVLHIVQHTLNLAIWKHEQLERKAMGGPRPQLLALRDQIMQTGEMVRILNDDVSNDEDLAADTKVWMYRQLFDLAKNVEQIRNNLQTVIDS